jgi:uncharacterized protein (DUF2147 family)
MKSGRLMIAIPALTLLTASAAAAAGPIGKWRVGDGTAVIALHLCGANLCGVIESGPEKNALDDNNPDPAQRGRRLLGLPILNLRKSGDNKWAGTVYNANDGQNYQANLSQTSETQLTLEGCVVGTNICGSDSWMRVR